MFSSIQERSLLIFGGKGGCGKTTSACATSLYLAQRHPKRRILIVSCDPAHSVGDSFGYSVGNTITPIKDLDNLWALEIKAEEEASAFKTKYDSVMKKIADRGTYFDRQDIESFFSLSIPGLDEIMAVIKIANILKEGRFDLIILDTAPTGHTIRLLGLPNQMKRWVEVMDLMQSKHRFLARHFTGKYKKDDADEFLEMMNKDVDRVRRLLKDRDSTEFIPVTIPQALAIEETERLLETLKEYGIRVRSIVVNQIKSSQGKCPFCSNEEKEQKKELDMIRQRFSRFELYCVPTLPYQVRGINRLKEYGRVLLDEKPYHLPVGKRSFDLRSKIFSFINLPQRPTQLIKEGILLYIFGGKGGVGKTSIASATGLNIAKKYPSKKVLVFSTDPAHSLSDSFHFSIGDNLTQIKKQKNLFGLEIDALKLLEDFKKDYKDEISETFNKFVGQGVDIKFDREILEELISITPPGLDEIMALAKVVEFIDEGRFDVYILDSAATGHLLRFLEMPHVAREWLNAIFKLLIKYKGVVRLAKQAEEMIEFSKKVRKIQEILTDPARCQFVVITIPEAMGKSEMDDLLDSLKRLKIPCQHILINMVLPKTGCNFCESKRGEQIKIIQEIDKERSSQFQISQSPLFSYQVKGIDRLKSFSNKIYG
ncbi:MAG: ArsA family ATPase [Candidatus Omnitrophica bacterium]|nr:ArsA family ATPase [Candidatus Omnitrophota bacterium]